MNRVLLSFCTLGIMVLFGCATTPPVKETPVFYPAPPDPPRIQFLKSFVGSKDVEPPKSKFLSFITGGRERSERLDKPYGIAVYNGKIYVCDTNQTVMVFDLEKKTYGRLAGAQGLGALVQPLNISIDQEGNKYVSDPIRKQVVMFDKKDFYVKAFGPIGDWKPVDAAPFGGLLYVVDSRDAEIQIFDIQSGAFRNSIGKKSDGSHVLALPTNIAFDKDGYIYVADFARFQIVKLDRDGNSRGELGSIGKGPGTFARIRGLAFDRQNRLYAVDAAFNNVQIFNPNGQLLLFFGKGGIDPGDLYLAAKIFIDYDDIKYFQQYADPNFQIEHLIFVTSQFGLRPVSVYAFGTMKGQQYESDDQLQKELRASEEKKANARKEQEEKQGDGGKAGQQDAQKPADGSQKTNLQETPGKTGDSQQKKD